MSQMIVPTTETAQVTETEAAPVESPRRFNITAPRMSTPEPAPEMVPEHKPKFNITAPRVTGEDTIRNNVRMSQTLSPDQAASDSMMAKLANVDEDFVARNRQEVASQYEQQKIISQTQGSTGVMQYLGIRNNAAVSRDDVDNLTGFERIVNSAKGVWADVEDVAEKTVQAYKGGETQIELAKIRYAEVMGDHVPADAPAQIKQLHERLSLIPEQDTFLEKAWYGVAGMLPQFGEQLMAGVPLGTQYGMGAGLAAATAGQVGPQIATPEEIITVPAAFLGGMGVGMTQGSVETSFKLETGLAFDEFMQIKDDEGNPIDVDTARAAAVAVGAVNAGIEMLQFKTIMEAMPGGKRLMAALSTEGMKDLLKNKAVSTAVARFAKTYGKTWAIETATEVAQDVVQLAGGEAVKMMSEGDFEGMSQEEFLDRVRESTTNAMAVMSLMALPGPSMTLVRDTRAARRASAEAQTFAAIDESAAESATKRRSPDHYEEAIAAIKKEAGSEVEAVYIPADSLLQSLPQETVDEILDATGTRNQMADALATGGDIKISLEKYARHIAGTEVAAALADHRKFTPEGMTPQEARIFTEGAAEEARALVEANREEATLQEQRRAEIKQITDEMGAQLREAGRPKEEVEASVAIWDSFLSTLTERGFVESPAQILETVPELRPEIIKSQLGRAIVDDEALLQPTEVDAAAAVTLDTPSGRPIIYLLREANASSFMHESGHVWLHALRGLATRENATVEMKAEWDSIREVLGIGEDNAITTAQHEEFAEGLERYLKEGKSPNSRLIKAFQSFAAWMRAIYGRLGGPPLSDELKPIFDRLLATDQEMADAELYYNAQKPFIDAAAIENKKQRERYLSNIAKAQESSRDKMFRRYMRAYIQALGGKKHFKKIAEDNLSKIPAYGAIEEAMADKRGFDLVALDAYVGEDKRKQLSKKRVGLVRVEGGMPPEIIAANNGFDSVDAMVDAMIETKPKAKFIKELTDYLVASEEQRIKEGLREDGTMVADEDYHSDSRLAVLAAEVHMLEQQQAARGLLRRARVRQIETRAVRDAARTAVGDKYVRDAVSYSKYAMAERKAANQADKARRAGDEELATEWKRKEMLNHALVLEAIKAREERATIEKRIKRLARTKPGTIADGYRNQIKLLSGLFGITGSPPLEGTPSISRFMNNLIANMDADSPVATAPPPVADWMSDNSKRPSGGAIYSDTLTMDEFRHLDKVIKWLYEEGRALEKGRLATYDKTLKEVVAENIAPMAEADDKRIYKEGTFIRKMSDRTRMLMAEHEMLPFMLDMFDGFTNVGPKGYFGPNRKSIGLKLAECENTRVTMHGEVMQRLDGPFKQFMKSIETNRSVTTNVKVPENMAKDGRAWTQDKIIAVALNMGNETNAQRIISGYGLSVGEIQELTKNLSREDWEAVQEVWDVIGSYWEQLNDEHEKIAHYRKDRVQAVPFSAIASDDSIVEMKGGYYPLKYDSILSRKVTEWTEKDDLMQNTVFGHPKVKDGMMQGRVQKSALPPLLDLSVVSTHMEDVINFISHAATIKDLDRITNDPEFRNMVDTKYGREIHMMIRPLLKNIANPDRTMGVSIDKAFDKMRALSSAYILGYNVKVALKQPFSLGGIITDIGFKKYVEGIGKVTFAPFESYQAMHEMSPFMKNRAKNQDRDIKQSTMQFKAGKFRLPRAAMDAVRASSFALIRLMDFLTVYPSWWGAYKKGMEIHNHPEKAARYADEMIRQSQPSATPMDLSRIQYERKGLTRFMSMFMTFTAKYGNRQRYYYRGWKSGKINSADYMTHLMLESIAPPILMNMMFAALWGEDQDPEAAFVDTLMYQFSGIAYVRDIAGVIGATYKRYGMHKDTFKPDLKQVPALEGLGLLSRTIESTGAMLADMGDDDKVERAVWAFAELASFWAGVPVAGLYSDLIEGVRQVEEEDTTWINAVLPNPALKER